MTGTSIATIQFPVSMIHGPTVLIPILATILAFEVALFKVMRSADVTKVRSSEERFCALMQNSSDLTALIAADGNVCYRSPSVKRILGYEPQNWQKAFEFVHPEDLAQAERLLTASLSCPGVNLTAEFRLRHADGQVRDFEVILNNLLSEPSVAGIVTTYRDITERNQAETARLECSRSAALDVAVGIALTQSNNLT